MSGSIGIRLEDKHEWERRVPLSPHGVKTLSEQGVKVVVQPSPIRAFADDDYVAAGAEVNSDLSGCAVVFAVKEIPVSLLRDGGAYVFFSHTIKGQAHNMPMLRTMMERGCTLIDYERIVDDRDRRLVFFGRHAGLAGMVDVLSVLGARLDALGVASPFSGFAMAHAKPGLAENEQAVRALGDAIREHGLPPALSPFVCGFAGYGNVSQGAQHIYDLLGGETVAPEQLEALMKRADPPTDRVFKVVFEERHLVERKDGSAFELQDYYDHPAAYRSVFGRYLGSLTLLVNAIYWTPDYPRLVTRVQLKELFEAATRSSAARPRLTVIGDISCDIDGAIACTVKATTPGEPAYVYDPQTDAVHDGVAGDGIAMMTTDCLPCELPRESSQAFTDALLPFVAQTARASFDGDFESAELPDPIRRATILWRGALTDAFAYLKESL